MILSTKTFRYGRIKGAVASSAEGLLKKINECLKNTDPSEIGSNVSISPQEFMMKLSMLLQQPSEEDQVNGLKELLKAGLKPDMVLMKVPAIAGRPTCKLTPISMLVGLNKALVTVLLDHGATVEQVNAEIDTKINVINQTLEKMNDLKKMLKDYVSKG